MEISDTDLQKNIIFDNVELAFDGHVALRSVNLRLSEPRIGIIGANGSGKTSLLRLVNGLAAATQGQISVDGLVLPSAAAAIRRKVGFVFQNPDMQLIMPTAAEDIAFGLQNLRLPQAEIAARVQNIIAEYELAPFAERQTCALSFGQKQLTALCGVLVMRPDIIVLDEPTAMLDLRHKNRFMKTLQNLPQRLIMTSHDMSLLSNFDRVLVMDKGAVAFDGKPEAAITFYHDLMLKQS